MPAPHELPFKGDDRKIVDQTFQDRVATGPADAVQHDVALADGGGETLRRKPRQKHAMIRDLEAECGEAALETNSKQIGDLPAPAELDEGELAVRHLGRNARENVVVLRQIFRQRLRAPINHGIGP